MVTLSRTSTSCHHVYFLIISILLASLVFTNPLPQSSLPSQNLTTIRMNDAEKQLVGRASCEAGYQGCIYEEEDYCCQQGLTCAITKYGSFKLICCQQFLDDMCQSWVSPVAVQQSIPTSTSITRTTTTTFGYPITGSISSAAPTNDALKSSTASSSKEGLSGGDMIALGVGIPSAIGAIVTIYLCATRNRWV